MLFLSIGSFVSTLILRLEPSISLKISNILFRRSNCKNCKKNISLINLIPIVGYLKQFGKCQKCKKNISIFYPLTEAIFYLVGIMIFNEYGISIFSIYLFLIFTVFYILFFLDLTYLYLPLPLNLSILVLGFTGNIFFNFATDSTILFFDITPLMFSLIGFICGYSFLWIVNSIYRFFNNIDGIGGGDFILLGGIGSIIGPLSLGPVLFMAASLGIIYYIFKRTLNQKELPLGSFIILGGILYFFIKRFELFQNFIVL